MSALCLLLLLAPGPSLPAGAGDPAQGLRSEYFLLEGPPEPAAEGEPPESGEPARAAVVWRRRVLAEGEVLEREIVFREGGVRVLHVEHTGGARPRLVWRELRPEGGRTWLAQWSADRSEVETTAWGLEERVHARLDPALPGAMPLELAEEARRGGAGPTRRACLAPLSGGLAPFAVERSDPWRPDPGSLPPWLGERLAAGELRSVAWRREDGSLAMRLVLEGARLVAFQLQEGELWARPVEAAEHRAFVERWSRPLPQPRSADEILAPIGR